MTPLPLTYKKNGYDYAQVERKGDVAIYAQYSSGKVIAYEVFEVLKQEAGTRTMGGVEIAIEEKEIMPSTEMWGKNAFTVKNLTAAQNKVVFLENKILERVAHQEQSKVTIAALV